MADTRPALVDEDPGDLRRRAEAVFHAAAARTPSLLAPTSLAQTQALLWELRVHQIELEIQNDELRRAQLELQAAKARWFDLYDLAPVGYCSVSEEGLILQANLAAAALLGLPRRLLMQRRLSQFITHADQDAFYGMRDRALQTGDVQSHELQMAGSDGQPFWVQLTASSAIDVEQGHTLRIVLCDISARKQVEAAQQAQRVAEQASRAKSLFLARMSHEFRTPLNAIMGFSSVMMMIGQPPLEPKQRQQLMLIHGAGQHLLQLVCDLLDMARIESGTLKVDMASVDALEVSEHTVRELAALAEARRVGLTLAPPAEARAMVRADATRLKQVTLNLLSNAIKFNREGGHVTLGLARHGPRWRVSVHDTGCGLSSDQQAMLYQPFNRLGQEGTTADGIGLGLVITRELVLAMGGELHVRSEPGVGSEFQVELFADDAAAGAPGHA